ncbi:MAG: hypothetical protein M1834_009642 [Cirrosporium novae-zelandiae]|nr:MAG: hypothetical protein M1834_009642 [Cirrosporium novae-zelandiae]
MTRPKVPDDKRQRIRTACESCKRRKQKCNGLFPCGNCQKRNLECYYHERDHDNGNKSHPQKKRMTQQNAPTSISNATSRTPPEAMTIRNGEASNLSNAGPSHSSIEATGQNASKVNEGSNSNIPSVSKEDIAEVYCSPRLLEDSTGRLLYVGDSSTLAHLQLIRVVVEGIAGPCPFTTDPSRHRISETRLTVPTNIKIIHLLPDKLTARVLVDSFFTNTQALLQVFNRKAFMTTLDECFRNPLNVDQSWLCLLNLVFAVGMILATPIPGTNDALVIDKLRESQYDRSEIFFLNAKDLSDPLSGFEDAGYWSIQALLLMSFYMLAKSKRNTAFAYFGMAVRSAFALGLHREEPLAIYAPSDQEERRNLFRSLYVLDRFLSASLGRPMAIHEDDCSKSVLFQSTSPDIIQLTPDPENTLGLNASVQNSRIIAMILRLVYQKRQISTKLAQDLADECRRWASSLSPSLHWRQISMQSNSQGVAVLHVNLFYCHLIILLTRPFFSFILGARAQKKASLGNPSKRERDLHRMKKFADACVVASTHSIALAQKAYERNFMPRNNPFVTYFLFAASLVVFANEFAPITENPYGNSYMNTSITMMGYCAESDAQATRLLHILKAFRDAVQVQTTRNRTQSGADLELPLQVLFDQIPKPADNLKETMDSAAQPGVPRGMNSLGRLSTSGVQFLSPTDLSEELDSAMADLNSIGTDEPIDFDAFWQSGVEMSLTENTPVNDRLNDNHVLLFGRGSLQAPVPSIS